MNAGAERAPYAELQATTHFSFLRGASSPEELFAAAAVLGLPALGVVDRNSVAGAVRAHEAARITGVRAVLGTRLDLREGASLLLFPTDKPAWSRLTRLLTVGKRRAGKGACDLGWDDLQFSMAGQVAVLLADRPNEGIAADLGRLHDIAGDRAHLALTRRFRPTNTSGSNVCPSWPARPGSPASRRTTCCTTPRTGACSRDVVTCIREGITIDGLGFRRERTHGRWLKPPAEMARLHARHPEAVARTLDIVERCRFSLDELSYQYPREADLDGLNAQEALARYVREGAAERYPGGVPDAVERQLAHELQLIAGLEIAQYFLTVFSIVRFARSRGILCQGRGSAANSAVCYVLGVTSVDPERNDLLFERFVSAERREPPDIDVDFEHSRREEVIQ